jgi:hypothetical protein
MYNDRLRPERVGQKLTTDENETPLEMSNHAQSQRKIDAGWLSMTL